MAVQARVNENRTAVDAGWRSPALETTGFCLAWSCCRTKDITVYSSCLWRGKLRWSSDFTSDLQWHVCLRGEIEKDWGRREKETWDYFYSGPKSDDTAIVSMEINQYTSVHTVPIMPSNCPSLWITFNKHSTQKQQMIFAILLSFILYFPIKYL